MHILYEMYIQLIAIKVSLNIQDNTLLTEFWMKHVSSIIDSRCKGTGTEITCTISYMLKNADDPCYSTKDQNSTYGERFYRGLLTPEGKWRLVKGLLT